MPKITSLLADIHACNICEKYLPHGVRPILQIHSQAKILIAGQAPGRKVHASGVPFDDASGDRLREWMGVTRQVFYDSKNIAIVPMGFCFPGTGKSGDLPPRPECALKWHGQVLNHLKHIKVTLVVGRYAQTYHINEQHSSVTETVQSWRSYWPKLIPLPHPSPRNNIWLSRNLWFEKELVPMLQQSISETLAS